jgi:hypothetical protein
MNGDLIDDLVLHLKGLVLVRNLLELRGASQSEIDEHSAEIARVRERLARAVRSATPEEARA